MRSRLARAVAVVVPVVLTVAAVLNVIPATSLSEPTHSHARPLHPQRGADLAEISVVQDTTVRGRYAPYVVLGSAFDEPRVVARADHGLDELLVLGLARGELVIDEYDDALTAAEASLLLELPHGAGELEDGRPYVVVEPHIDGAENRVVQVMSDGERLFFVSQSMLDRGVATDG